MLDGLTKRTAEHIADLIVATGTSRVVFAEVPPSYMHLLDALERAPRKIDVYATWYNSFMISRQRSWQRLKELEAARGRGTNQEDRFREDRHGRGFSPAEYSRITDPARAGQGPASGF